MKIDIIKRIIAIIISIGLLPVTYSPINADETLYAKSAVLIDGETGRILYGKEPEIKLAMASTTKIMTCIVALENCQMNKIMTVSKNAVNMPKVRMNVRNGEQYYLEDLLYALMLESYNDVAVVIAENVAGSVENFAKLMNDKAKEIGAKSTNFVTPNGLDANKHYSTAYDMALIGAYAVHNKDFVKIVNTTNRTFKDVNEKRNISVSNKDAFLIMDKDAIGIKTGFTGKAGYCFVGAVKSEKRLFVTCVLASGWPPNKSYKWHDTKVLMKMGKDNYEYKTVLEKNVPLTIDIENGTKNSIESYVKGKGRVLISKKDSVELDTEINYKLPIKKNDVIGNVRIYINGNIMESHPILSKESVREFNFMYCLEKTFDYFVLQ